MRKISDGLLLGVLAGLGGSIVKLSIGYFAKKLGWAEIDGPQRAAGMLVPPHKIADPRGKFVGWLADGIIGAMLGVVTVYALSVSGKDKAVFKGALAGQVMWTALYGVLATMGATKVKPVSPKTVLSEFIGHTAYGAVTAALVTNLGDEGLFTGEIPISAGSIKQAQQAQVRETLQQALSRVNQPDVAYVH
ncbi:hypothetical protein ACP3TJ_04015 [Desulforudis sp. 1088]|uniref:hypothetical protein n=1 Tax=unclassified Candidatus Desulforudis TaxID=2635950 RepID=UPI003490A447